ncbi:MAG: addiction module protein [Chthoniobacterales bacterium]
MATAFEKIAKNAMQFPSHQRVALAGFLLEIDNSSGDPTIDKAWDREICKRIQAIDLGDVKGLSYQGSMPEVDSHLAP